MKSKILAGAIVAGAALAASPSYAMIVMLDQFDHNSSSGTNEAQCDGCAGSSIHSTKWQNGIPTTETLGGSRAAQSTINPSGMDEIFPGYFGSGSMEATWDTAIPGTAQVSAGGAGDGVHTGYTSTVATRGMLDAYGLFQWDGADDPGTDGSSTSPLTLDLSTPLGNFVGGTFHVQVVNNQTVGTHLELFAYDAAGNSSVATLLDGTYSTSGALGVVNTSDNAVLDFGAWSGAADLSDVRAFELLVYGAASFDVTLGDIWDDLPDPPPPSDVPEPASLVLLGMGLLGAGVARRRTRKA